MLRGSIRSAPRPRLRVSNILGLIGVLNRDFGNLIGARLIRRRTLARFLDAVNFPGSANPDADPVAGWTDEPWRLDRKTYQDHEMCEYELASPLDVPGKRLPGRQIIARICGVGYRSPECGYAGPPVANRDDQPTSDPVQDRCGCRPSSCKLRFPIASEGIPFGGFPGVGQFRRG
jgi:lambda family phage minor tail protein L